MKKDAGGASKFGGNGPSRDPRREHIFLTVTQNCRRYRKPTPNLQFMHTAPYI